MVNNRNLTLEQRIARLEGLFSSYGSFAWLAETIRKARSIVYGVNGSRNAYGCATKLRKESGDDTYVKICSYLHNAADNLEIAEKLLTDVNDDQGYYK
jgi:hypothetical protein